MESLFLGSDNYVKISGIQNIKDSSFINAGTVQITLLDSAGVEVTGQTWPLTMSYIAASDGDWDGNINDDANLVIGQVVTIIATADGGAGLFRRGVLHAVVKEVDDA